MSTSKALRCHLIYCLQLRSDGSYIALNRNYKPIGVMDSNLVEHTSHVIGFDITKLHPSTIQALSCDGNQNPEAIYFYNDNCIPFEDNNEATLAYMERLARFASLRISPHEALNPHMSEPINLPPQSSKSILISHKH